jgi:hypothetical protein
MVCRAKSLSQLASRAKSLAKDKLDRQMTFLLPDVYDANLRKKVQDASYVSAAGNPVNISEIEEEIDGISDDMHPFSVLTDRDLLGLEDACDFEGKNNQTDRRQSNANECSVGESKIEHDDITESVSSCDANENFPEEQNDSSENEEQLGHEAKNGTNKETLDECSLETPLLQDWLPLRQEKSDSICHETSKPHKEFFVSQIQPCKLPVSETYI